MSIEQNLINRFNAYKKNNFQALNKVALEAKNITEVSKTKYIILSLDILYHQEVCNRFFPNLNLQNITLDMLIFIHAAIPMNMILNYAKLRFKLNEKEIEVTSDSILKCETPENMPGVFMSEKGLLVFDVSVFVPKQYWMH